MALRLGNLTAAISRHPFQKTMLTVEEKPLDSQVAMKEVLSYEREEYLDNTVLVLLSSKIQNNACSLAFRLRGILIEGYL